LWRDQQVDRYHNRWSCAALAFVPVEAKVRERQWQSDATRIYTY
jgi:hypothetical protein